MSKHDRKTATRHSHRNTHLVVNALRRNDRSKGALTVEALRSGMSNEEVFHHLDQMGHVPYYNSIEQFRIHLRNFEDGIKTDQQIRKSRGGFPRRTQRAARRTAMSANGSARR